MVYAETQDLGIRDLPDAHAQLIEMQLLLEEISSNVEVLQEKVRARPCCSQQCLMWHCQDNVIQHAVLAGSHRSAAFLIAAEGSSGRGQQLSWKKHASCGPDGAMGGETEEDAEAKPIAAVSTATLKLQD